MSQCSSLQTGGNGHQHTDSGHVLITFAKLFYLLFSATSSGPHLDTKVMHRNQETETGSDEEAAQAWLALSSDSRVCHAAPKLKAFLGWQDCQGEPACRQALLDGLYP